MVSQGDTLPTEIICYILCFLDSLDVVRMREVSKRFRDITYQPVIWKTLYTNARLPRPPGPFPFQSTHSLERTLVRSARLAKTWTTQHIEEISSFTIPIGDASRLGPVKIVCEKWLVDCESSKKIILHDIETGSRQVLLERELIYSWDACSITSAESQLVYVVYSERRRDSDSGLTYHDVKLVECRVNNNTGQVDVGISFKVPMMRSECVYTFIRGANGPFLKLQNDDLVFDIRTQRFHIFPEFRTELNVPERSPVARRVFFTATHIIALTPHSRRNGCKTVIQCFIPQVPVSPRPLDSDPCLLRLTHEAVVDGEPSNMTVTRNSIFDPKSGTTNMRFLLQRRVEGPLRFTSVDLTLSEPIDGTILPITLELHDIIIDELAFRPHYHLILHLDSSDDGHVRGISMDGTLRGPYILKFTIDASRDGCPDVQLGVRLPLQSNYARRICMASSLYFDAFRGRFFLNLPADWASGTQSKVVVVEIK